MSCNEVERYLRRLDRLEKLKSRFFVFKLNKYAEELRRRMEEQGLDINTASTNGDIPAIQAAKYYFPDRTRTLNSLKILKKAGAFVDEYRCRIDFKTASQIANTRHYSR